LFFILCSLLDENWQESSLDELDFEDILKHIVDQWLVEGVEFTARNIVGMPRVNRKGLQFIEDLNI